MTPISLADMRRQYDKHELLEAEAPEHPLPLFTAWFEAARQGSELEANAFVLSTLDEQGRPRSRVVLLKEFSEKGFVFFTNYESAKAKEMALHPQVSLLFHWNHQERQVRVNGRVSKISRAETEAYFKTRPRISQIGAWASPQSSPITREVLEQREQQLQLEYEGTEEIPTPPQWGGYLITMDEIEFWQGRPGRLHDRLVYRHIQGAAWLRERLAP
jgi:pyridoxamine 5'-phosphate oxidase